MLVDVKRDKRIAYRAEDEAEMRKLLSAKAYLIT